MCVSCSDEFDYIALRNFGLFKELRYQLHSIFDKNLSTVGGWTFAKFFLKSKKNVKCRCIDEKNKYFVRKKNLSVRGKIFKVWGKKNVSVEFRVFGKKMEIGRKVPEKKEVFFALHKNLKWKILLSLHSLVGL